MMLCLLTAAATVVALEAPTRRLHGRAPRLLLVDCNDSYTQNVAQWLAAASRRLFGDGEHWPRVVAHDDLDLCKALREEGANALSGYDALVLSPGPGHPTVAGDFAETAAGLALRVAPDHLPVLGVCLGHQGLAVGDGYTVERLQGGPRHGIVEPVYYDAASRILRGMPQGFMATRYHSLTVKMDDLSHSYKVTARTLDGCVQAMEHESLPRFGVQFHPESVATPLGPHIADNFLRIVAETLTPPATLLLEEDQQEQQEHHPEEEDRSRRRRTSTKVLSTTRVELAESDESPFRCATLYRELYGGANDTFWIDGGGTEASNPVSVVGDAGAKNGFTVRHDARSHRTRRVNSDGETLELEGPLLDRLREWLGPYESARGEGADHAHGFDFRLGFVGYLGYELRSETRDFGKKQGSSSAHDETGDDFRDDAALLFATRAVVVDHRRSCAYVMELLDDDEHKDTTWRSSAMAAIGKAFSSPLVREHTKSEGLVFRGRESLASSYREKILASQDSIVAGDAYEICLTTSFAAESLSEQQPIDWYLSLREGNAAPRAAFFDFGDRCLACTSPETFLRVADNLVESKPIKGTSRRRLDDPASDLEAATTLSEDVKSRAEHLMIADLVKNDLQRVCTEDSVAAVKFCQVESFATVHQLVSTIQGQLRSDCDLFHAINATFPPGSMTGAPKRRACEIIDVLEATPRGAYSGCCGYIGLDGAAHLAVVIRSALFTRANDAWHVEVGAGGAITCLSDADEEIEEVRLKARAVLGALGATLLEEHE